ncbi:zinc-dependent metalloprotease [Micrococcus sp.]|uniref:zinc-dependent metalloprotease n=1 Tax=Micrococcus sp. TaxID=1271 RepID=UPI002A9110E2|nr:zinc-dependent metalloprotease [Micrococcus sp.]MDY6055151.1 zinc-dependent metalloprotease [Micrococcus sp.]
MTDDPRTPGSDDGRDPLQDMLRQMFGGQAPDAEEIRRAMQGMGGPGGMPFDPSALDPSVMQQAMAQFQAMMSPGPDSDGPVNWSLATQAARQAVAGEDPSVGTFARREVDDALRLAELWLDGVTDTAPVGEVGAAWSRAEWVEATAKTWRRLTEPVAESLSAAMSRALEQQLPSQLPEGMDAGMLGGLTPMLRNMGGTMFGLQLGGAVGTLGKEVLSGTDIGLPIAGHRPVMIPVNIEEFGDGLNVPDDQLRLYLALREVARLRLFLHSPWLERDLFAAVEQYAAGLRLDTSSIERAAESVDPADPSSMQAVFEGASFIAEPDATQRAALDQLELLIALVEGWVDVVVAKAAAPLESAQALRETMNRRRASGGPAEEAFAALVGLELRPRRLREAAAFWEHITDEHGVEYREEIWSSPERQPTAEDLDDPAGYGTRRSAADASTDALDDELRRLLDGGYGEAPKEG